MQLCDRDICEAILNADLVFAAVNKKYPFEMTKQVQPASIDLRLGNRFVRFSHELTEFDIKNIKELDKYSIVEQVQDGEKIVIGPHEIVYGQIYEQFYIGEQFSARIEGRSRVARLGISVHCTGDYINPGFTGTMPLQIINHNPISIVLYPYIGICQMILYRLTAVPTVGYKERGNYNEEQVPGASIMSADPLDGFRTENTIKGMIIQEKLNQIIDKYNKNRNPEESIKTREKEVILLQYIGQIENYINSGDIKMGDKYISENTVNQGKNAGKNSINFQYNKENSSEHKDYQMIIDEINKLRDYIKKSKEYDDDAVDIIAGDLVKAKKALENEDEDTAVKQFKKLGKEVYQIAKNIGCSLLVKYFSGELGI